jgi:superfamily II DNA or RNA helicase
MAASFAPRDYQIASADAIGAHYSAGVKRVLYNAATGSGKSATVNWMVGRSNLQTLILCHREELRDMICESLTMPYQVIEGNRRATSERVCVGMYQTVSNRLATLPAFQWVIEDECHTCMAPTFRKAIDHYSDAWHLGLSASPCRLDGQGLGAIYDKIVFGPTPRELIDRGLLLPCRAFAPEHQVTALKKSGFDFNMESAAELFAKPEITGNAFRVLREHGPDLQTIGFCCTRKHAEEAAGQARMAGFRAMHVDGSMPPGERAQALAGFRSKRIQILFSVDLLTTGYDNPEIGAAIMLRPTDSLALIIQMYGRAMRPFPGMSSWLLIDSVGNTLRHGLPDADREWTLDGRVKRTRAVSVRQCEKCWAAFSPAPRCPECGYTFPVDSRRSAPAERAGNLVEIGAGTFDTREQRLKLAPLKELLRAAHTREAVQEIADARGYAKGWVYQMMQFKQRARERFRRGSAA